MTNFVIGTLFILLALNGLLVWWVLAKVSQTIESHWITINWLLMEKTDMWDDITKLQSQIKQLKIGGKK